MLASSSALMKEKSLATRAKQQHPLRVYAAKCRAGVIAKNSGVLLANYVFVFAVKVNSDAFVFFLLK